MNCMKCGREVPADQVFCETCRADMQKYPVKPGIAVQLPKREDDSFRPVSKRPPLSSEAQLARIRHRHRLVTILLVLTILLAGALGFFAGVYAERQVAVRRRGQNYSTAVTAPSETDVDVSRETSENNG